MKCCHCSKLIPQRSPSDYFCNERCQYNWQAGLEYKEPPNPAATLSAGAGWAAYWRRMAERTREDGAPAGQEVS